nr:immunoglobulin heavy chain junction region [Macaca mulatta]MOV40574.1 immunoglobulin heavy chain junction region [Macaca mulatta]MOV42445.1 immunoglobulin heavy chain junction region [Macaca mulatta]MOV42647.1 immunoglobulin heavy chain junction region [Macaca mulatta]MOV43107.1 immunoglobulin heavy chain junction region [Macaca mulatta]
CVRDVYGSGFDVW